MHCDILSIFPAIFEPVLNQSLLLKAQNSGIFSYRAHNLRDWAKGKHKQVDDSPFGGGPGMVFKPESVFDAVEDITKDHPADRVILMSPQGKLFNQEMANELALAKNLLIICGRYEGIDERVAQNLITDEISIGDYVLNGGELPAMVLIETVVRLIPGVLGDEQSAEQDSFFKGLLDYPHYTRPADFRGMSVPEVLLSGNHEEIRKFRRYQSLKRTLIRRPDLLEKVTLTSEDKKMLSQIEGEIKNASVKQR